MKKIHGSCLCGRVRYEMADNFLYSAYCHCSECRRFSGSAFSAMGGIAKEDLEVTAGAELIRHYRKTEASNMAFCGTCGSSLFVEKPLLGRVHVRLGTLAESPSLLPQAHVMVGSKAPWYKITDNLPQFETVPPVSEMQPKESM